MKKLVSIVLMLLITAGMSFPVMADHKAFQSDSLKQIEQQYAGKSFLLVLWEVSCFPCHEEMVLLEKLKKDHPDTSIVLVATDNFNKQQEVNAMLESHDLGNIDSWLFADANIEKLRYSIDPEWFGELPRNYIYDTDSSRIGISGMLTQEILDEWVKGK